ncbi:MAG: acetolactate synthase small subunit [Methanobacteriota archaeon]
MAKKIESQIITALVEHKPGVLQRISSMFSRRRFNIDSITVGPTEKKDIARMTILTWGDEKVLEQITKQLNKLPNVIKVMDITGENAVLRELCLIKIHTPDERSRSQVIMYADVFRANIVDVGPKSLTVELTGDADKINAFVDLSRTFGIRELARTGMTAMQRG